MTRNNERMMRATVTAGVVFLLAAGAHIAGGAALPDPLILGTLAVTTVLATTVLSRRKLSLPSVLGVLGAGQVLLHEAFSTLTTTAACVPSSRAHFGPQQVHCAPAGGMEHAHASSLLDNPLMFAAHAGAVVATALMLYYGETALELAAQWLRPLVALPRLVVFPPPADLPVFPDAPVRSYLEPLLTVRPLRGPPLATSL
ncbi:MAG: hypothetical protein ACLGHS_06865 [Actinomycetes bacterium]